MKAATVSQLKKELSYQSKDELLELCLRLSKFKRENKELLTYLLFEADNEDGYIETVKNEIEQQFELINTSSYYYIKKSVRKILRNAKKYIRYSKQKETEIEILLHFCRVLKNMKPSINKNTTLLNILNRQLLLIRKVVNTLHEDLQYDYTVELSNIKTENKE
ncbi:MAG TPA: hypothetical protein ENK46_07995 [Flavobacteriia bacterium]|nr:hypothetical protein [Flavobacteriia bacterium]